MIGFVSTINLSIGNLIYIPIPFRQQKLINQTVVVFFFNLFDIIEWLFVCLYLCLVIIGQLSPYPTSLSLDASYSCGIWSLLPLGSHHITLQERVTDSVAPFSIICRLDVCVCSHYCPTTDDEEEEEGKKCSLGLKCGKHLSYVPNGILVLSRTQFDLFFLLFHSYSYPSVNLWPLCESLYVYVSSSIVRIDELYHYQCQISYQKGLWLVLLNSRVFERARASKFIRIHASSRETTGLV